MKIETKLRKLGYSKPTDLSFINQYKIKDNEYVKIIEDLYMIRMIRIIAKNDAIVSYNLDFGPHAGTSREVAVFNHVMLTMISDLNKLGVEI